MILFISPGGIPPRRVRHELRRDWRLARRLSQAHERDRSEQEAVLAQVRSGAEEEEVEEHRHQARRRRYAQGEMSLLADFRCSYGDQNFHCQ